MFVRLFKLLASVPAESRKVVARVLLFVAAFSGAFGLLLTSLGIGGGETVTECDGPLLWKDCEDVRHDWSTSTDVTLLVVGICFIVIAVTSVIASVRLFTMQGHLNRYLAILTGIESMSVMTIANITGSKPVRVREEVQSMIDAGALPDFHIDYGKDLVVSKRYIPKMSHKTVVTCPTCHANNDVVVGITKSCAFCRELLVLRPPQAT